MKKRKDKKKKKLHEIKYPWMAERKEKKIYFFYFSPLTKKTKKQNFSYLKH